jgi:hypothetical protein
MLILFSFPWGKVFERFLMKMDLPPTGDTIARNFIAICLERKVLQTVPSVFGDWLIRVKIPS